KCTVFVVSATPRSPTGPVLLGVDVATPVPSAVEFAFDAADRHGTDLVACYVWDPVPFVQTGVRRPHNLLTARRMLEATLVQARAAYPDVAVHTDVVRGSEPASDLLNLADGA